jgi:hypothetical protein
MQHREFGKAEWLSMCVWGSTLRESVRVTERKNNKEKRSRKESDELNFGGFCVCIGISDTERIQDLLYT